MACLKSKSREPNGETVGYKAKENKQRMISVCEKKSVCASVCVCKHTYTVWMSRQGGFSHGSLISTTWHLPAWWISLRGELHVSQSSLPEVWPSQQQHTLILLSTHRYAACHLYHNLTLELSVYLGAQTVPDRGRDLMVSVVTVVCRFIFSLVYFSLTVWWNSLTSWEMLICFLAEQMKRSMPLSCLFVHGSQGESICLKMSKNTLKG